MRCDKMDEEMCEWAQKARCEEFWMGLEIWFHLKFIVISIKELLYQ